MSVIYYETRSGRETVVEDDCFARIDRKAGHWDNPIIGLPDIIRYPADLNVTKAQARSYAEFLRGVFGARAPFTYRFNGNTLVWTLKSNDITRIKALVYLTAFRYVDELPRTIRQMLAVRRKTIAARFNAFQDIHAESVKACDEVYNLGGHTLMYLSEHPHVNLSLFRARLRDSSVKTVNDHFAPQSVHA